MLKSDSKLLKHAPGHILTVEKWPWSYFQRWKMTGWVIIQWGPFSTLHRKPFCLKFWHVSPRDTFERFIPACWNGPRLFDWADRPLSRFRQGSLYSPKRIASQSATLKEWSVQSCRRTKHKIYSSLHYHTIVLSIYHGSYFRRRKRLTIFVSNEMKFASSLTLSSL